MSKLLFGHARRGIDPSVPVSLAGYFNIRMWTEVLDGLFVQALALKDASTGFMSVLVHFDLVGVSNEFMARIRDGCADIDGLADEDFLFTATHTHTAPEIRSQARGGNPDYNRFAVAQAVAAVHEAAGNLKPGDVVVGKAFDDRFAFNRRYWMTSGEVVTNPPRRSPDIDKPEGPIDPKIGLLGFRSGDGLEVLLTNVVNHSDTTEGCQVSADWPGALRRALEKQFDGLQVIPVTGAAGNINHFDPNGPDIQSGPDVARRIGEGYAETVSKVLADLVPCTAQGLRGACTTFRTGPREIDPEELAQAREHAAKYTFDGSRTLTSEDLATKSPAALKYFADHLIRIAEDRHEHSFEVHALLIGDAVLVTLPGEPFVEIGLTVKQEFTAARPTLIAALNQDCAYIPNRFNYGRGGYETTPRCSPYSIETGEHLLQAARTVVQELLL